MTIALCPLCGHDLEADAPIVRPEIIFDPRGAALFHGHALDLTPGERIVMHTLLRANGVAVDHEAVKNRLGTPEMASGNTIAVLICRLRVKLAAIDSSREWIGIVRGVGYRWAGGDDVAG